jgi:small subunit ribosomal protein S16
MLMIRLQRVGRANDPSFRVVLTDKRNATKSGRFLEILGSYNARFGKAQLNKERVQHWINHGAQVTDTIHNLFANHKILMSKKVTFANKPKKVVGDAPAAATPAAETPTSNPAETAA